MPERAWRENSTIDSQSRCKRRCKPIEILIITRSSDELSKSPHLATNAGNQGLIEIFESHVSRSARVCINYIQLLNSVTSVLHAIRLIRMLGQELLNFLPVL